MCGRFLFIEENELAEIIAETQRNLKNRGIPLSVKTGEIFPTDLVPILRPCGGRLCAFPALWGFTNTMQRENQKRAGEGKKPLKPKAVFNTRGESAAANRFWRDSYLNRRCLVPTAGFYEWQHISRGEKQEYIFTLPGEGVTMLAGIWHKERYEPLNTDMEHFSVITTEPGPAIADVHDRMPVVLRPQEYGQWLHGNYAALLNRKGLALARKPA